MRKILLVGDSGVGKTSLLNRFVDSDFKEEFMSTIGVDFRCKTLEIGSEKIKAQLWDTAGQERFNSITSSYYRGAQGVLLVYDVANRKSFANLERWLKDLRSWNSDAYVIVVGNKLDLNSTVGEVEAKSWAKANNCDFYQVSCKTDSLDHLFFEVVSKAYVDKTAALDGLLLAQPKSLCCVR